MEDQTKSREGNLMRGGDEKLQGRKIAAWICFILGIGLLIQGSFLPKTAGIESKVLPAIVALIFSLLFWGLLTIQNVVQLVALLKGQNSGLGGKDQSAAAQSKEANDGQ
ncbi:MAG: hypothetical protein ABSF43_15775 [Rectinemataceae bacterium]|jgi:TRAP-type C4-dicarboxylate transport system permease small subunit